MQKIPLLSRINDFFQVFERSNSLAKRMTKLLPPKFDRILSDHDAVVGENVVMSVATRGVPEPEIHFYQDGKMLSPDEKVLVLVQISMH